jgi:hypothetical protein
MATEEELGHWILEKGVSINKDTFGFIYEITNILENKIYIGKKQCNSRIKRKPLKGKKRNRIDFKQSDWKTYTSSSENINKDIERLGKSNFIFKIIKTCSCKWELAYYEAKIQFERNVLFDKNYYNGIINLRIGSPPKNLMPHEN